MELLERALRALAPERDVLSWHVNGRRSAAELDRRGGPTYGLRVRYVLRSPADKGRRRLGVSQVEAVAAQVTDVRGLLQAGKHASAQTVTVLRAHLLTVETLLHQLLLAFEDPGSGSS